MDTKQENVRVTDHKPLIHSRTLLRVVRDVEQFGSSNEGADWIKRDMALEMGHSIMRNVPITAKYSSRLRETELRLECVVLDRPTADRLMAAAGEATESVAKLRYMEEYATKLEEQVKELENSVEKFRHIKDALGILSECSRS